MFGNVSTIDLELELKRRKEISTQKPGQLDELQGIEKLRDVCKEYITDIYDGGDGERIRHYVFECAIECVYGKRIWGWINRQP